MRPLSTCALWCRLVVLAALGACGGGADLEPVGTIVFQGNGAVPVDLYQTTKADSPGELVEWEEIGLIDDRTLGITFASTPDPCGNPDSTHVVESDDTVVIGIRRRDSECSGVGDFKAVRVALQQPLGNRIVLNELCHQAQATPACGPVDEIHGSRLRDGATVNYLNAE